MILIYVLMLIAILVAVLLCAIYYVYREAFDSKSKGVKDPYDIPNGEQYQKNKEEMITLIDALINREYEDVYVTSFDGLRLHGRYYHVKDGAPVNIGFHGYRATALRDFCVGANESLRRGHNLILIDERGQGESEGKTITMGIKERYDALSWANYAVERFGKDVKIVLYGVSMGASTVIMSTALDLPKNVTGVVADCPYDSPKDILLDVCEKQHKIPKKLGYPLIFLAGKMFGEFDINATTCSDSVKKAKIPVVILHGEDDLYVPCDMSKDIQKSNSFLVSRYTFPFAGHGLSFFADKERYRDITEKFFYECTNNE